MNTGSQQFGRPSIGAWVTYGLGSESQDLPGFVVFSSGKKGPSGGNSNWGSGFLPTVYQGVQFRSSGDPVLYLSNPAGRRRRSCSATRSTRMRRLNEMRLDSDRRSRNRHAHQLLRDGVPHAVQRAGADGHLDRNPKDMLDMYGAEPGKPSFANNCLLARRLVERGVRFVQLFHEAWDQHGNLVNDLKKNCHDTDQACRRADQGPEAARPARRHARHLGRRVRPHADGAGRQRRPRPSSQRLHHVAGRRRHQARHHARRDRRLRLQRRRRTVHVHDLHATILHLLGFDHTQLTYRFQGRDFRLTDVHGKVVSTSCWLRGLS